MAVFMVYVRSPIKSQPLVDLITIGKIKLHVNDPPSVTTDFKLIKTRQLAFSSCEIEANRYNCNHVNRDDAIQPPSCNVIL